MVFDPDQVIQAFRKLFASMPLREYREFLAAYERAIEEGVPEQEIEHFEHYCRGVIRYDAQ